METVTTIVDFLGDLFTVMASALALYLYFFRRGEIGAAIKAIANFAYQSTLAELRQKLEALANLHASNGDHLDDIVSTWHDVCGQIEGNPALVVECAEFVKRVKRATNRATPISQPQHRALISQLREKLRHIDVTTFADALGETNK
ncbi:hypothetical protein [Lysobacter fragariae]